MPKEKLKPQEKIDYINYIVKFLEDLKTTPCMELIPLST